MKKESDRALRQHLIYLLTDGGAHVSYISDANNGRVLKITR